MTAEDCIAIKATAATLRAVAGWGLEWPPGGHAAARDELCQIASAVEGLDDDDVCCPVCEEVRCDEGCPLEGIRKWEQ